MVRDASGQTNGSQFFITLGATPELNDEFTVFGQVVEGLELVQEPFVSSQSATVSLSALRASVYFPASFPGWEEWVGQDGHTRIYRHECIILWFNPQDYTL